MKIYVKEYLRKIPILERMCNMIIAYASSYSENDTDNYSDYRDTLNFDDVARFIDYVSPDLDEFKLRFRGETEEELKERRKNHVNYLIALFYSVKGTYKVLDYLTEYDMFQTHKNERLQGQDTTSKISYSTRSITITIVSIPESLDRDMFCTYLEKFLCSLLYFENLTITIEGIGVSMKDTTTVSLNHGDAYYQYYEIKSEDI